MAIFLKKCQVFCNFLTFKWQFSGGSALGPYRTAVISFPRLCLHQVFKYRCVLKSQWCYLPKQLKDWLEEKDRLQNTKQSTETRFAFSLTGSGPDISQLSVYVGDTGTAVWKIYNNWGFYLQILSKKHKN